MFTQYLLDLIYLVRHHETMPATALSAKLSEEVGELSEHALLADGYCSHKAPLAEDPEGEAADVINCALAIVIRIHIDNGHSDSQIATLIMHDLKSKLTKYNETVCGDTTQ